MGKQAGNEIWAPIARWEGKYEVSSIGQVRNLQSGVVLKPRKDKDGYLLLSLWDQGKKTDVKIHRIVATAFILNPSGKPQVNHKDGDKANNRIENLEWATDSENKRHCFMQLHKPRSQSGHYGVCWRKDRQKWRAYTTLGGYRHLGLFMIFRK
jgi:hypothetical protein